jgi:hypothetical protein
MMTNTQTQSLFCNEASTNTMLLFIFLLSFFIFRIISNKGSNNHPEAKAKQIKKARKYIENHRTEDAAFFMQTF